jgi:steroid 5-alpha reductase family enzyme|tara:strand:+ start:454 stop:705 length:252 start_codon:yes stop_codon:yes gene_type:complete
LGEIGFWLALAIAGYIGFGSLYAWLGFFAMVMLFLGISIPMIDKRQLGNKKKYAQHPEQVASLMPNFGARAANRIYNTRKKKA